MVVLVANVSSDRKLMTMSEVDSTRNGRRPSRNELNVSLYPECEIVLPEMISLDCSV